MTHETKLFVGSSDEAVKKGALAPLVKVLRSELPQVEIVPWKESNWRNLKTALDTLSESLVEYSYGVFLAFPDDEVTIRDVEQFAARDNVIFEFGLFLSRLGPDRTFLVAPTNTKIPPSNKPFRILTDLGGAFRAGGYTINSLTSKRASVVFKVDDLVKKIRTIESDRLDKDRRRASQALKRSTTNLESSLLEQNRVDAYYSGTLREAIEALIRYQATTGGKSIQDAVKDVLLYFRRLPDLCDVKQLADVQSYKRGLKKVWVFADAPMEFLASKATDPNFAALRRSILDNLAKGVKYVYFVSPRFKVTDIDHLVSRKRLSADKLKSIRRNISVVMVEPRLFKTYFTLHFNDSGLQSVYMSSVEKDRDDLLIQVSDQIHTERIYKCIRALGQNIDDETVSVLDLVSA